MKAFKRFGAYLAVCMAIAMLLTTMPAAAFAQGAPEGEIPAAEPMAEHGGVAGDDATAGNEHEEEHEPGADTVPPQGEDSDPEGTDALPADEDGGSGAASEHEAGDNNMAGDDAGAGDESAPEAESEPGDESKAGNTGIVPGAEEPSAGGVKDAGDISQQNPAGDGSSSSSPASPAASAPDSGAGADTLAPEAGTTTSQPGAKDDTGMEAEDADDESEAAGSGRTMPSARMMTGLLDVAETWDSAHLQALIDAASGTLVLEGDFVLDKTVSITKPLVIGGTMAKTATLTLADNFHDRHFAINTDAGTVQLQFLNLVGHGAPNNGGGVYHSGSGALKVQSSSFTNNSMGRNGGGLESDGPGDVTLTTCRFENNVGVNGGGVYAAHELVVEQQSYFSGNEATNNGGGVWAGGLIYDNSEFTGNAAGENGGGLYVLDTSAGSGTTVSYLYGGSITGNTARNGGGIAFDTAGRQRLSYIEVSGNTATNNGGGLWLSDDWSGSVYVSAGAVLDGNVATNRGGGAYGGNWFYVEKGAVIQNNTAAYGGGAISSWGMYVNESYFQGNHATKAGGGIYMMSDEGILSLQYSDMTSNTTDGLAGGAIYLSYYTNIYTLYCNFAGNHSARGVYWEVDDPAPGEQEVAAELYPNDILHTTCTVPFTNIFNDWDVAFFFDKTDVFAVTFVPNGGEWQGVDGAGSATDSIVRHVGANQTATVPGTLTKGTDTLAGWYTDPGFTNAWNIEKDTVQKDMTLYAKWASYVPNTYTVTFYDDETGTGVFTTLDDQPENRTITEPDTTTLVNPGYDLAGWFTEPEYLNQWDFDTDLLTGDLNLYARWREDGFVDIVFMNEGTVYDRYNNWDRNEPFDEPAPDPERDGYLFTGWFTEDGTAWDFGAGSDDDLVLYAGWRDDQLADITYMDGDVVYRQVNGYPEGALLKAPTPPQHEDKVLTGWLYKKTGQLWDFGSDRVAGDMTLYAQYKDLNRFTVTFVDRGTTLDALTVEVWELSTLDKPADLVAGPDDDLVFGCWTLADGSKWDFDTYTVRRDTTLYARWRDDGLVDADYYVEGSLYAHEDDLPPGEKLAGPAEEPTLEGRVFDGWLYQPEGAAKPSLWDFSTPVGDKDMVLVARFRDPDSFPVEYWVGEDFTTLYDSFIVLEGSHLTPPRDPRDAGFTFGGWYTDKALTDRWDFVNDTVDGGMDLYARFRGDGLVDIVFEANGETWRRLDDFDADELVPLPDEPEKEGHRFLGWYTEETGGRRWDFDKDYAEGDMTLYAQWEEKQTADITYEVDGKEYWTEEAYVGDKLTPPGRDPEKKGYAFDGWYKDKEGTIPWDFDKDIVEGNTTLYAKWREVTTTPPAGEGFDVVYIVDGAEYHREVGLLSGVLLTAPSNPAKPGHTFGGWYRGSAADMPTGSTTRTTGGNAAPNLPAAAAAPAGVTGRVMEILLAPDEAALPAFWVFENDTMPGELLVLVAWFDEDPADGGNGGAGSNGGADSSGGGTGNGDAAGSNDASGGAGSAANAGGNAGSSSTGPAGEGEEGSLLARLRGFMNTSGAASSGSAGNSGANGSGSGAGGAGATGSNTRGSARGNIARTGDNTRTTLWVLAAALVLLAGGVLVAVRLKRKRQ